jgi:hypothetical protein
MGQRRGFVAVSTAGKKRGLAPALEVTVGTGQRCPFCHEHLQGDDALVACSDCLTVFHDACVAEGGGCTTMGCAHARPDLVDVSPAARVAARKQRGPRALLVLSMLMGAGGLGLGLWALLREPVVPRPPIVVMPPPPPPPPKPALTIERFDVQHGDAFIDVEVRGAWPRGTTPLATINGVPLPLVAVNDTWAEFRVVEPLPAPWNRSGRCVLQLEVSYAGGPTSTAVRWVETRPPSPPPAPVELTLAVQSIRTADSMVDVRGLVRADGPVTITVGTPAGDVSWESRPGPFQGTVTVGPRAGVYELVVRVRDRAGRESVAVQRVDYAP